MQKTIRFGILGGSDFAANHMAPAIHAAKGAKLAALATSSPSKAALFQAFCPDLQIMDSYEALLATPDIDAVYIPLPNHLHVEWSLKAIAAGKHVLCEKPIALKADEIDALIAARDATGLLVAEAYMIVHHPQWLRAKALLEEGAIGRLMHVEGVFTYNNPTPENIRNRPETGGGAIPDIGVYPYGATRWMTGAEPVEFTSTRIEWENNVDVVVAVGADFGSFTFQSLLSMRMANRQEMVFHGDKAVLRLGTPFNANVFDMAEVELSYPDGRRVLERFPQDNQYVHQVENYCHSISSGAPYAWTLEQAQGTQAMIDRIYAAAR